MKKRHYRYMIWVFAVMMVFLLIYVFLPESEESQSEEEIKPVAIEFLDVDPTLADSLMVGLSDEELILQHIVWRIPADSNFELKGIQGGGFIVDADLKTLEQILNLLDTSNKIAPYLFIQANRQFLGVPRNMNQDLLNVNSKKIHSKYRQLLNRLYRNENITGFLFDFNHEAFGLDYNALNEEKPKILEDYYALLDTIRKQKGLICFDFGKDLFQDSSYFKKQFSSLTKKGVPFILTDGDSLDAKLDLREHLKSLQFNGLIGVSSNTPKNLNQLIDQGADLIVLDYHPEVYKKLMEDMLMMELKKEKLSYSIKRNLLAKTWIKNGLIKDSSLTIPDSLKKPITDNEIQSFAYSIAENASVLVNNKIFSISNLKKGFTVLSNSNPSRFVRTINQYSSFRSVNVKDWNAKVIKDAVKSKVYTILILENIDLDTCKKELREAFIEAGKSKDIILLVVGNASNLIPLNQAQNLIYTSHFMDKNQYVLAKQICGVLSFNGKLGFYEKKLGKETGIKVKRSRMGTGRPEEVGLNSDTLARIDYLVRSAMNGRAFPGCQVLVVKNGQIVYDKNFGHDTYDRTNAIDDNDVYDIASLTKVVATTMVAMKLYELKAYRLDDSLYKYLPEDTLRDHLRRRKSSIRDIRFDEILTHKSGLPEGAPIIQYLDYIDRQKEIGRYDRYYCDEKDDTIFCVEIAKDYYLDGSYLDSMWLRMNSLYVNPTKEYKYSDVNMNLLYRIFKSIIAKKNYVREPRKANYDVFSRFLDSCFYRPLEMKRTTYLPRMRFDTLDIVPTEDDKWWRNQLLRGYVHDPNAALYGGIAGNAGVFSNKTDLAKLFQMLLDGGTFEGKRYLQSETVELFTQAYGDSHRGLGFNKQSAGKKTFGISPLAPSSLFGHTGFTGTCVWADPDNEIILVFLSNRVHPKVNKRIYKFGVRKNIHDYIYRAIID
ncbi:MAG: serine hydrolase [Crocinitomicaceae bacterium]|nr:serine hydrolase [Crocinitomicaceae bacterium]